MAALEGFTLISGSVSVLAPLTLAQVPLALPVPPRCVVAGADLTTAILDTHAVPTLVLDVGDGNDVVRYLSSTIGQTGGTVEARPASSAWWRYITTDTVDVLVGAAPATGATGTISLTLYTYAASDYAALRRMVLQELMVLAAGEEPSADDADIVDAALSEVHEELRFRAFGSGSLAKRGDLAWPLDLVPDFAARSYARLGAEKLMTIYSLNEGDRTRVERNARLAEQSLARQTRVASRRGTEADYEVEADARQVDTGGFVTPVEYY